MKRFLVALPLALPVLLYCGGYHFPFSNDGLIPTANASPAGSTEIEPGIWRQEVRLRDKGDAPRVWIYRPLAAMGRNLKQKFPCVFIGPSGTTVTSGAALSDHQSDTHTPYARAGMIVVAYELDGLADDQAQAARGFERARMGLRNSHAAISYALKHIQGVDSTRLFAVGHSSGGTIALQTAEYDPRIRACVAFAPACNFSFPEAGGGVFENAAQQEAAVPGFSAFLKTMMPQTNVARIKCPLFLFSADDDNIVSGAEVQGFARAAQQAGVNLTFMRVPHGGHTQGMHDVGIPAAIQWLQKIPFNTAKVQPATGSAG